MKKLLTTVAGLGVVLACAPAYAQNREHLQMASDLRMVQEQTQQLARTLAELGEALKAINARIGESEKSIRKEFADRQLIDKRVADDLSVLTERTRDTYTRLGEMKEELDALRTSLPSLVAAPAPVTAGTDPADPAAAPAGGVPAVPVAPPSTLGLSANRLYEEAWGQYTAGQYTLAITGFEQVLKYFPDSGRADDAQYQIGEAYFLLNRVAEAAAAYNATIQKYSKGDQTSMAYLKLGQAQQRLGQNDAARATWEQTMTLFPNTPAASMAKQRLGGLPEATPSSRP